MAIQDTMRFLRTGAATARATDFGPNNSLGGFESGYEPYVQSTLTAAMTALGTLVDSAQVDSDPAGPVDQRTPLQNSGPYQHAASLAHWYRFSYDRLLLGRDYGLGPLRHLSTVRGGLAAPADVDLDVQPGHFDQQRDSLHFNSAGAADNDALVNPLNEDFGVGNAFTFMAWARTTTTAAGVSTLFHLRLSANLTTLAANSIRVQRSGASLLVQIMDTGGTLSKQYTYLVFFTANTWQNITLTWNGTTLQVYSNGVPISPSSTTSDDAVTLTNTTRRLVVGGGNNNATDPQQEWFGQIHSLLIWTTALPETAIDEAIAIGDGVGFTLDHTGEWLVFVTGANAMEARRIAFHDNATGTMHLEQPLPNLGSAGDVYRVSRPMDLFDDGPAADECAQGVVDFRCIAFANESGGTCNDTRFWLKPLDPRTVALEIAVSSRTIAATALPTTPDDETPPNLTSFGPTEFSGTRQSFRQPYDYGTADDTPTGTANILNTTEHGIWVRRTTQPLTRRGRSAWLLVAEASSHSVGGAGPFLSPMVIASGPVGFTPDFQLAFDRTPRTFGGARVTATLRDADLGTEVEGVPVEFELTAGLGALASSEPQPLPTDADGRAAVQYTGPADEGEAGATVEVTARFYEVAP